MTIPTTSKNVRLDELHPRFKDRLEAFFNDPEIKGKVAVVSGVRTYWQQKYLYDGWIKKKAGFNPWVDVPAVGRIRLDEDRLPPAESNEVRVARVVRRRQDHLVPRLDQAGEDERHRARRALGHEHPLGIDRRGESGLEVPHDRLTECPEATAVGVVRIVPGQRLHHRPVRSGGRREFGLPQLEVGDRELIDEPRPRGVFDP